MNAPTQQEMHLWIVFVKNVCGIILDESKAYLVESRLSPLARELGSATWQALYDSVRTDASGKLRRRVIDAITTGETSFFRDTSPFELMKFKLIPDLIDARRKVTPKGPIPLRIWSAASSTGQETYSIAITLREILGANSGIDARIFATDISDKAIATASYGKYSRFDIERGMPVERLERNFLREGDFWRLRDEVRALTTFKTMNLLEPFTFPYRFDIIFCRNVAIYFSEPDRKRLFDRMGAVLSPDGCIIIGSTESITGLCPQFESKRYLRAVFYQLKK